MNLQEARIAEGNIKVETENIRKKYENHCYRVIDVQAIPIEGSNTEYQIVLYLSAVDIKSTITLSYADFIILPKC